MIKIVCETDRERERLDRILRLGEAVLLLVDCIMKREVWNENREQEKVRWEVMDEKYH